MQGSKNLVPLQGNSLWRDCVGAGRSPSPSGLKAGAPRALSVVQEMCVRLGAATGRGLLDLIRERFGLGWTLCAIGVILLANGGVVVSEFVGIGATMELLGISKYVTIPLGAAVV